MPRADALRPGAAVRPAPSARPMRGRRLPRLGIPLALAVALAGLGALTGCAAGLTEPSDPPGLPAGITASVLQSRQDVVDGRLVVQLDNATGAPLSFASFDVEAPGLEPGLHFDGPRTIPDGRSVQYRVDLTSARCDGDAGPATVALTLGAGGTGGSSDDDTGPAPAGTIEAADPYDTLRRLQNSGCLDAAVERVATFELADRLRSIGTGTDRRAWLDISVTPTGSGDGSVDLLQVLGTTLLSAEDGLNWATAAHVAASDAPSTISLPVRPARCDPHAGAEDKRGTILPLVMTTSDGWKGDFEVRASAQLKADLFAYFTERCGLAEG